ncbi:unnamed protein product [Owenia fusiformis]|uniref:Sarcolemmal membrane-associated protein n=1 Tax=Owenia fusiformis TaxID=6347 RepID=A0A8J1T7C0_OWEFU|nr:unnamed protein product [Owenia fusiformis]
MNSNAKCDSNMSALAVLTCRPNSHPFQERHVSLHEPAKIGRSVARARPAPNNSIFDCKVLSRNHALIWYEEGRFFLQDTKSSNGTFVNSQRLSKGSEESPPREIMSGDVIQFGVDVMENSRRVTHSCIIASLQLFYPDGREAKPSGDGGTFSPTIGTNIYSQELYQLSQYLQEALHREQMLENKLATLQRLVQGTQEASEQGWQALVDEDRLLSRLEVLENQLQAYAKNQTKDNLKTELLALQDDKLNYENSAKESLRKVLQEKLDAVTKLSGIEHSLSNTEDECEHLRKICETSQNELEELATKHKESLNEVEEFKQQLSQAELSHKNDSEKIEKEKEELEMKIEEMQKEESSLLAKIESLQADNDFTKNQLTSIKARLESMKESEAEGSLDNDTIINTDMITKDSTVKLKELEEQIEYYKDQLDQAQMDAVQHITKIASLEGDVAKLEAELLDTKRMLELQRSDAKSGAIFEVRQFDSDETINNDTDSSDSVNELSAISDNGGGEKGAAGKYIEEIQKLKGELLDAKRQVQLAKDEYNTMKAEHETLNMEYEIKVSQQQVDMKILQDKLQEAQQSAKQSNNEAEQLKSKLQTLQDDVNQLQHCSKLSQGSTIENSKGDLALLKEECANLRKRIQAIEGENKQLMNKYKALEELKAQLEGNESTWQVNLTDAQKDADKTKKQLSDATEQISSLKDRCSQYTEEINYVTSHLRETQEELNNLALRSKSIAAFSMVPLFILFFAIVMAFYPALSEITATSSM